MAMAAFDYKTQYKELYQPKTVPSIIDVPEMAFIMVNGRGDPNTSASYQNALEILYGLSYAIKMSKMSGRQPEGYFDYVVPPLEGLWWVDGRGSIDFARKNEFCWIAMIRQPDFVTLDGVNEAKARLAQKKPELDLSVARLEKFAEGECAQVMHVGPYDNEPATIALLERYIAEQGYRDDLSHKRRHHELYLSDPRKTAPEKLKTIIRHPIRR